MNRRDLLLSWKGLAGALAALVCYPTLHFWWRSSREGSSSDEAWSDLGPLEEVEEGTWQRRGLALRRRNRWRMDVQEVTVYVRRVGARADVVSAVCPHAGCSVQRLADGFACPCHRSAFDAEGRSLSGPAPRRLDRLEWAVEAGHLKVRYERFRTGLRQAESLEPGA